MEELLNKLIEKGWKPRGYKVDKECMFYRHSIGLYYGSKKGRDVKVDFTIRQLVSKESGLWQFVCENELIKLEFGDRRHYNTDNQGDKICLGCNYPYWLIESALIDESELEDFLLSNIKVEG